MSSSNDTVQITFTATTGQATAAFRQMASELKIVTPAVNQVNNSFKQLDGTSKTLGNTMKGLASAFAVWKTIDIARNFVQAGMAMQNLENRMRASVGSNAVAADSLKYLRSEAERLGLDFRAAADGFSGFAAAALRSGLTLEQTKQVFTGVSEAAAAMGLSAERQKLVFQALAQMASKGTVSMEELRQQLGESLPGALQIFASAMGVSTGKFMQMVAAGEVLTPDLVKLGDTMHEQFGQRAVEASRNATGEMNRFQNALFELKAEFMDAGPMDVFTQALRQLTDLMKDPDFIQGLKDFAGALATITTNALQAASAVGAFFGAASNRKKDMIAIAEEAKANGEWFITQKEMAERLDIKAQQRKVVNEYGKNINLNPVDKSGGLLSGDPKAKASGGLLAGGSPTGLGDYTMGELSPPKPKKEKKEKSRVTEWDNDLTHMLMTQEVFLDDAKAKELAYWQDVLANQKLTAAERGQVEGKVYNLQNQLRREQLQNEQEANRKRIADLRRLEQAYYQTINGVLNSFNSSIRGMLTGTQTFGQAFRGMLIDILMAFVKFGQQMLARWIAVEIAKTAATTAGEGTRGAVQVAYQSKSILADSKATFAGVYANLSPIMGPFAAIPAAGAAAVVLAAGATLPSFDHGAYELPGDMVAQVHKGETILNASEASNFRSVMEGLGQKGVGGMGGGTNVTFQISALDGPSVKRMLRKERGTIASMVASAHRDFNPKLPAAGAK